MKVVRRLPSGLVKKVGSSTIFIVRTYRLVEPRVGYLEESSSLVTTCPSAVRIAGWDARVKTTTPTCSEVSVYLEIVVDSCRLQETRGFLGISVQEKSSRSLGIVESAYPLVGRMPDLLYPDAYLRWVRVTEDEALQFLLGLSAGFNNVNLDNIVKFAAGRIWDSSDTSKRNHAWKFLLRQFGSNATEMEISRITRSPRTAVCKAALLLGWVPSVPQPRRWKGLLPGVTIVPFRSCEDEDLGI